MKNVKLLLSLLKMFLFLCIPLRADTIGTVYFNGDYAFANNGYGIPPYGGTLDGIAEDFYCVDFAHDISAGGSWKAYIAPVSGTTLEEEAWLATQMLGTTSQTQQAEYQWAIWSLSGGTDPYGQSNANALIAEAQSAINGGYTGAGWEVLTPVNWGTQPGQQFVVQTPEGPAVELLLFGLLGVGWLVWKKKLNIPVRS